MELAAIKPDMSVFPSFVPFNEAVYYVLEANEKDFTQLLTDIGLHELAIFESTGSIILYEDNSNEKKESTNKIKEFCQRAWARIKALFERILNQISAAITDLLHKKIVKDPKKLAEAVANLPTDYEIKTFEYNQVLKMINNSADIIAGIKDFLDNPANDSLRDMQQKSADRQSIADNTNVKNDMNQKSYDDFKKVLTGNEITIKKSDLTEAKIKEIMDIVTNYSVNKNKISNVYKANKEVYESIIKEVDKGKADSKDKIKNLKLAIQDNANICNTTLSVYFNMFKSYMRIAVDLNKALAKTESKDKKNQKDQKVDESAYDSEVASLFSWSY